MKRTVTAKRKYPKLAPNATCMVCGKAYRDSNDPVFSTPWCSVACQFSRFDDIEWCEHNYHPDLCVKCDADN